MGGVEVVSGPQVLAGYERFKSSLLVKKESINSSAITGQVRTVWLEGCYI